MKRDPAAQAREEQNLKNLELGGIPVSAEERLRAQSVRPFFATNLSVAELGLVRKSGYQPVGQVMGSSVYHIGWQFMPTFSWDIYSQELSTLTEAHQDARRLALSRLEWETRLLGAHGVVGVRLDRRAYEWGANLVEFSVVGTAIRLEGVPPTDKPFLSDLSGEEFYQLWQAGFEPVGFAYGNCFWYEVPSYATQSAQSGWMSFGNQELTDFSQAVHRTRDLAMQRMEYECAGWGATGVVGVEVSRELRTREIEDKRSGAASRQRTDLIIHMQITGTAIREREITRPLPLGRLCVSLSDLPMRTPPPELTDNAIEGTLGGLP